MSKLFTDASSDSEGELKINDGYAKSYDSWRHKEELNKLKTKYGNNYEESDSEDSSDSSEDDEGTAGNDQKEQIEFFKCLTFIKTKDPRLQSENFNGFSEPTNENRVKKSETKKEKALFLKDYERKIILEKNGKFSDDEDEAEKNEPNSNSLTYVKEQKELKDSLKKIVENIDEDDDDFLKPKSKSEKKTVKVENDYKEWIKGHEAKIDENLQKELKPVREFWSNPNLDETNKYLRDYILNKMYLEPESKQTSDLDAQDIEEDNDSESEEFERKYNFRFEDPDEELIKRYPRTLEHSLRRKDTRRQEKRAEVKKRKEEVKIQKKEEIKQLKAAKRKELQERINKLKEVTGNDDMQFDIDDLEGDFDPNEHEKKMKLLFNDEYYADVEDVKPDDKEIDEELGLDSNWDDYDPNTDSTLLVDQSVYDGPHCEDPEFIMDADYDQKKSLQAELVDSTKRKKKRRRSKFAELIAKEKPKYDPSVHPSYQEYFDEYYALNCEDIIDDLPCRFKWHQVVPNSFGLSVDEIMMADDRELNKWCSLKRALQYKPEHVEINDVKMYQQKASNENLKKKILMSLYRTPTEENEEETEGTEEKKKKRKPKKKKKTVQTIEESTEKNHEAENETVTNVEVVTPVANSNGNDADKKKKKKKRKRDESCENQDSKTTNETATEVDVPKKSVIAESDESFKKSKKRKLTDNSNSKEMDSTKKTSAVGAGSEKTATKQKGKKHKAKNQMMKKQKVKQDQGQKEKTIVLSDERIKDYGTNPKKYRNLLKYGPKK